MNYRWILLLLLSGIAILGLATFSSGPLLYSPEKDSSASAFHQNPAVFRQAAVTSANDIVPLMQDALDGQKPVVLDIRANGTATVERNLARYDTYCSDLQEKFAQYRLKGGEFSPFLTGVEDQRQVLHELVRQSEAFSGLQAAAARTGGDRDATATIASQTLAWQEKEKILLTRYLGNSSAITRISSKIGLDTRSYEQARDGIQGMLKDLETAREIPPLNMTANGSSRITLLIEPGAAQYGDTVQIYGIITPAQENQSVRLFLDNTPFTTVSTDSTGNYYVRFMVERIEKGAHTVSATTGSLVSPQQALVVRMSGTTTTLNAEPGYRNYTETGAYCDGTVMAGQPVRNAPVTLLAEGNPAMTVMTAENGTYRAFLPLSGGSHSITAEFSADSYPLNPSFSPPVSLVVPATPIRLVDLLIVAAFFFLVIGGVLFWLIRHPPGTAVPEPDLGDDINGLLSDSVPAPLPGHGDLPPEIGTLYTRYQAILNKEGLSEATRRAYLDLAARIALHLRLPAYRTLTARELSSACASRSYSGIFDIFVDSYERIRYGGSTKQQDKTGFEQELKAADTETGRKQA